MQRFNNSMTRRSFLAGTGSLLTATTLLSRRAEAQTTALPNQGSPLAVRIMSYGKYQESAWTHLPTIGVHYLFLPVPKPAEAAGIQEKLAKNGLKALVFRGETDLSKESCVSDLDGQFAVCAQMGVKYLFLSAKRNEAPKEIVYDRLRRAGESAQRHGVTLTLETHPDLCTNGTVQLETMKAIQHPNVRINLDTANISYYNPGADAGVELKKVLTFLGTVELKDHTLEPETWNFPVLGQGKVNFPEILRTLREAHYTGPITIEFEGVKGTELNETQTQAAIADSVAYLNSLARFQ